MCVGALWLLLTAGQVQQIDLVVALQSDQAGLSRLFGAPTTKTYLVPQGGLSGLAELVLTTSAKVEAMAGAELSNLTYGVENERGAEPAVSCEIIGGKNREIRVSAFGPGKDWKFIIGRLKTPPGKLWWDRDDGNTSLKQIPLRSDVPEAKGWDLRVDDYVMFDESGMVHSTGFTASRPLGRVQGLPRPSGGRVAFSADGAFLTTAMGAEGLDGVDAIARKLGMAPGTYTSKEVREEWMQEGTWKVTLRPTAEPLSRFEVQIEIRGGKPAFLQVNRVETKS